MGAVIPIFNKKEMKAFLGSWAYWGQILSGPCWPKETRSGYGASDRIESKRELEKFWR